MAVALSCAATVAFLAGEELRLVAEGEVFSLALELSLSPQALFQCTEGVEAGALLREEEAKASCQSLPREISRARHCNISEI